MKVHNMIVLLALAGPMICNAGPILVDRNGEQASPQGLHSLGLKIGGDKDKDDSNEKLGLLHRHDRPVHFGFGTHSPERGWKDHDSGSQENHPGRYSDRDRDQRPHCGDGPVQNHLGDHDGAAVPDAVSTALLLTGTLVGLLALARTTQAISATAKIQRVAGRLSNH
jgi:hypothetical protein